MKSRRLELMIFFAAFFAFAWFHQGGGWNQNARFAEVRAMAEEGRFAIDDFIVYQHDEFGKLSRSHVENGDYSVGAEHFRLMWNEDGTMPVNGLALSENVQPAALNFLACSGDVGFARGHFHPNKPPGTSFAALPAYFILSLIERAIGCDLDGWWTITVNAWLTSAFSVGLASALGCVVFFQVAKMFAGNAVTPALLATIAFAFGTMIFPFATLLFDHNLVAVELLAAFYFILRDEEGCRPGSLCLSGFCAGFAAITNYVAAVAVVFLGVFLLVKKSHAGLRSAVLSALWFLLGLIGPFALICFYNNICYGSPFALCNDFQNPRFKDAGGSFLGMFGEPSMPVAMMLLFSQYRGLFFFCPALLLAVFGFFVLMRSKPMRAEACFCAALFVLFYWVNVTFNGWSAGYASGPRYLIPAMPFLALLAVPAFARFQKTSCVFAAAGVAINFLSAAVDAECPVGTGFLATIEGRSEWENKPVQEFTLPLFLREHPWPLLEVFMAENLSRQREALVKQGVPEKDLDLKLGEIGSEMKKDIEDGTMGPSDFYLPLLYLATIRGPVSSNPIGSWEGIYFTHFQPRSPQCVWSSFNAGEFLFPESRLSVLPMLLVSGGLLAFALRECRKVENNGG